MQNDVGQHKGSVKTNHLILNTITKNPTKIIQQTKNNFRFITKQMKLFILKEMHENLGLEDYNLKGLGSLKIILYILGVNNNLFSLFNKCSKEKINEINHIRNRYNTELKTNYLQTAKHVIINKITAKPTQKKYVGRNTIGFISETISYYALKDAIEELGFTPNIIYNSQFNGLGPKKRPNDEGPDLIVQNLNIGNEVKARNKPNGYFNENESNEVASKFDKDFYQNKIFTLYNGYKKEKVREIYRLLNKNRILVIEIPYPIPYTEDNNFYHFNLQEIEKYVEIVYPIVKGKYKYYLNKIIRLKNNNLDKKIMSENVDHVMFNSFENYRVIYPSDYWYPKYFNLLCSVYPRDIIDKEDSDYINSEGSRRSILEENNIKDFVSNYENMNGHYFVGSGEGSFIADYEVFIGRKLFEAKKVKCPRCARTYKNHHAGEVVKCMSRTCKGRETKLKEMIEQIYYVGDFNGAAFASITPEYLKLKEDINLEGHIAKIDYVVGKKGVSKEHPDRHIIFVTKIIPLHNILEELDKVNA